MKLVVLSSQPLQTLEEWVRAKFSAVPNRDIAQPKWTIPPYLPTHLAQCYRVVPVQAVPTTVVLDRECDVAARILGRADPSTLRALLDEALAEQA